MSAQTPAERLNLSDTIGNRELCDRAVYYFALERGLRFRVLFGGEQTTLPQRTRRNAKEHQE